MLVLKHSGLRDHEPGAAGTGSLNVGAEDVQWNDRLLVAAALHPKRHGGRGTGVSITRSTHARATGGEGELERCRVDIRISGETRWKMG